MKKLLLLILFINTVIMAQNFEENKMILMRVSSDPTIVIKIWFKVGSQDDPDGKEGLAAITASLIAEGSTINNSYENILELLYPLAASYGANASMEMTIYSGRTHKDNLDEYYSLFIDGILNPAFAENDFKRIKDNYLNYLNNYLKYSNDEELGKSVLHNSIFNGSNYGHISAGLISSVEGITIKDVKEFYTKHYNRNNYVIAVGGAFNDDLIDKLKTDLNKLPDGNENNASKPEYKIINGLEIDIVEKNTNATAISMGFPINILRGAREWYALAIANSWFGEHRNSSSHLYQVIREARGLNYGDYSYIEHFPNGHAYQMPRPNSPRKQQIFEIWIRPVPNYARHFVLRTALRELQLLVDNGMNREDFELTKSFLKKYVLHYAPSVETRLGYAIDDKFYGVKGSHLEIFRKMMNEITFEETNAAIKKHLQYKNVKISIITNNVEEFKDALIQNVESPINYSTPKSPDVYEMDKQIINYELHITRDKINVLKLEELFK